jgi:hypothetical protein
MRAEHDPVTQGFMAQRQRLEQTRMMHDKFSSPLSIMIGHRV